MGKRRRKNSKKNASNEEETLEQKLEERLSKTWCYYCDREFDDEAILIQHQKTKHFKCPYCPKKLVSVKGMKTHVLQVHKENINFIPNAKLGRNTFDFEIQGMQGIPDYIILERQKKVEIEIFGSSDIQIQGENLPGSLFTASSDEIVNSTSLSSFNDTNALQPLDDEESYEPEVKKVKSEISAPPTLYTTTTDENPAVSQQDVGASTTGPISFTIQKKPKATISAPPTLYSAPPILHNNIQNTVSEIEELANKEKQPEAGTSVDEGGK